MSTPFQNRLVGTVIVAAMAIIFLPDVLDGDKKIYQEEFERIPPAPKVDFPITKKTLPEDKKGKLKREVIVHELAVDDLSTADDSLATKASLTKQNTSEAKVSKQANELVNDSQQSTRIEANQVKSLPEKAKLDKAWVIQLGSFRHKNNVDELLVKLKAAGYTTFTKPIKTKSGTLTKVFVGPELIKSSLEKKLPALKRLTNVQGKIAQFKPTS